MRTQHEPMESHTYINTCHAHFFDAFIIFQQSQWLNSYGDMIIIHTHIPSTLALMRK